MTDRKQEDDVNVTITKGTQTVSHSGSQDDSSLLVAVANLANRFLHASYWFITLNIVFTRAELDSLSRTTELRQSISILSAQNLLSNLLAQNFLELADIAKPDFSLTECSVNEAVKLIGDIDTWLLASSELVLHEAKMMGNLPQIEVLENIVAEQKIFSEESEIMNAEKFIKM